MRQLESNARGDQPLHFKLIAFAAVAALASTAHAGSQQPSQGARLNHAAEHKNMDFVGWNDLQARSSYQPTVHKQGNRYIAYVGHHPLGTNPVTGQPLPSLNPLTGKNEPNGTSIIDVTDPAHPVYLAHIPVGTSGNGGAQMVRVCDGSTLPVHDSNVYMLRSYSNSAHEIWNVVDPANPQPVRTVKTGNPVIGSLAGTHKNWWECDTGIAYIVGRRSTDTANGWKPGNHIMIFDLGHPASPTFIRDWALDGQQPGGTPPPHFADVPSIHGPISTGPEGGPVAAAGATPNRVYFAYGTEENGVMQIVDRAKLLASAPTDYVSPEVGRWVMNPVNGAHTSFPLGKIAIPDFAVNEEGQVRDIVAITSEETNNECTGPRNLTYFVDATEDVFGQPGARPQGNANFQVPEAAGAFCDRVGRFGPHSTQEEFGPPFYQKVLFVAYFNAGVRAVDVRDPFKPTEIGYYIPATNDSTDYRCKVNNDPSTCKIAIQTNNVATDDRGYIYIVDRADTGMHVLRLSGSAKAIIGQ
jgi:hypothetical protein